MIGQRSERHLHSHPTMGTFSPGEYGRIIDAHGEEKWWVRAPNGNWVLLTRHQVTKHEDGTITVSPLK